MLGRRRGARAAESGSLLMS